MGKDDKNILMLLIIIIIGGGLFYFYDGKSEGILGTVFTTRELNLPLTVSASTLPPASSGTSGRYGGDSAIYYKDFYGAEKVEVESYLSAGGVRQGRGTCENWGSASANIECSASIGGLNIICGGVSSSVSVSDWSLGMSSPKADGSFISA